MGGYMKIMRIKILIAVIAAVGVFGCNDEEMASPSKRPLLVDKTWATVSYEMGGEDITDEMEPCETDNTLIFFADGTFIQDYGDVTCDEFETNEEGVWNFKANESVLSMRLTGEAASDWKILELSATRLKISQFVQLFNAEIVVTMEPE